MLTVLVIAFGIVSICLVIHTTGMVILAEQLLKRRAALERQPDLKHFTLLLMMVFAIIIMLHLGTAAIWAAFYQLRGLFPDYETSFYFSLKSYSTIGYGDVLLPQKWRLLGCVEGISGVLLCGLSTAFIFVIVNALIQIRTQQQTKS
jgi:voltage-gated potassium channel